jgi:hypothetical protein
MTPLDKCIQFLAALVRLDDPRGVVLMEEAVDSFTKAAGPDSGAQIAALDVLAHTVRRQGWDTQFAGHILAYIAQQRGRPRRRVGTTEMTTLPGQRVICRIVP